MTWNVTSGKSSSLRNLDPDISVVVQVLDKRLPFPEGKNWKKWTKDEDGLGSGSRINLINIPTIIKFMDVAVKSGKKIIIIDDLVYTMANKVMEEVDNKEWDRHICPLCA